MKRDIKLLLDNVRSAHNVGSIFRTADATGVSGIYLVGSTPTPIDRFGRVRQALSKTALGATETVAWQHVGEYDDRSLAAALTVVKELQAQGYTIVAVELSSESIPLQSFVPPEKVVYILGAEVEGVDPLLLKQADVILELPMLGQKESLNVSVTAGVVLYHDLLRFTQSR